MSSFGRDIRENPFGSSFWLFLSLSFAYGVIHAAGPGHGKTVVSSYFLNRHGTVRDGILMSNLIAFFHVSSAVAVMLIIYATLKKTGISSFEEASPIFQQISYALLLLVGIYLFSRTVYGLFRGNAGNHDDSPMKGGIFITALAVGIIPCPGAAIILSFCMIIDILVTGLISMLFIALGMGLTVSIAAVLTILSRRTLFNITKRYPKVYTAIYATVSLAGPLLLISLSGLMLLYHLQ